MDTSRPHSAHTSLAHRSSLGSSSVPEMDLDVDTRSDVSACTSASTAAVVDWTASGNFDRPIPELISAHGGSGARVPPSDQDSVADASEVSDLPAVSLRADLVSERAAFNSSGGSIDSRSNSVGSASPARAKFLLSGHLRASGANKDSVSSSQESEHDHVARTDTMSAATAEATKPSLPLLVAPGDSSRDARDAGDSSQLVESFAAPDFVEPVARDLMSDSLGGPLESTSSDMSCQGQLLLGVSSSDVTFAGESTLVSVIPPSDVADSGGDDQLNEARLFDSSGHESKGSLALSLTGPLETPLPNSLNSAVSTNPNVTVEGSPVTSHTSMRALVDPESLARELSSDVLRNVMREDTATDSSQPEQSADADAEAEQQQKEEAEHPDTDIQGGQMETEAEPETEVEVEVEPEAEAEAEADHLISESGEVSLPFYELTTESDAEDDAASGVQLLEPEPAAPSAHAERTQAVVSAAGDASNTPPPLPSSASLDEDVVLANEPPMQRHFLPRPRVSTRVAVTPASERPHQHAKATVSESEPGAGAVRESTRTETSVRVGVALRRPPPETKKRQQSEGEAPIRQSHSGRPLPVPPTDSGASLSEHVLRANTDEECITIKRQFASIIPAFDPRPGTVLIAII